MNEPTRLLLIQGSRMAAYHGTQCHESWTTGDEVFPVDEGHYADVMPVVFDEAWYVRASDQGRRFPVLLLQSRVMELQAKLLPLTYADSSILA